MSDEKSPKQSPIRFDIDVNSEPSELDEFVSQIQTIAERYLYHWDRFPIVLPPPIDKVCDIDLQLLYRPPSFNELGQVAVDQNGKQKKLSNEQLHSIRSNGEFRVPSINFPGHDHVWKLPRILQKGRENVYDTLLDDCAQATGFIVITARDRLCSNNFSIYNSLSSLWVGSKKLIDIFIGFPSVKTHEIDNEIRKRLLVQDLTCDPGQEEQFKTLIRRIREQLKHTNFDNFDLETPYLYLTHSKNPIDLRLLCMSISDTAAPILKDILDQESYGWFPQFRNQLIEELQDQKLPQEHIEATVSEAAGDAFVERVMAAIGKNEALQNLGTGIPELLVEQLQSFAIITKCLKRQKENLEKTLNTHRESCNRSNPILSRLPRWMNAKLKEVETRWTTESAWTVHEEAIKLCLEKNLKQAAYFLERDLVNMRDKKLLLEKSRVKTTKPTRTFDRNLSIWCRSNWIIKRHCHKDLTSEVIPTVISDDFAPETEELMWNERHYSLTKNIHRSTTTRWPGWRLNNLGHRCWIWTWNVMFLMGVCVPLFSSYGLRALFGIKPFNVDLELSQVTGKLHPIKHAKIQTLASRLVRLWRAIFLARERFEAEPNTGLIDKSLVRFFHQIWHCLICGVFGSALLLIIGPVINIFITASSLALALTAPMWVPIIAVAYHFFIILIFDVDCPDPQERNRWLIVFEAIVWNLVLKGVFQLVLALIVATILCPLISLVIIVVGVLHYGVQSIWDVFTFNVFIKRKSYVPLTESYAAQRITGPGLSSDYYFLIQPEQALATFETRLELEQLRAYEEATTAKIKQPMDDFKKFVEKCFEPFSAKLDHSKQFKMLEEESTNLLNSLNNKITQRRKKLQLNMSDSQIKRIKLDSKDLKVAIQQGAGILKKYIPSQVFPLLQVTEIKYWDSKDLPADDWTGLAAQFYTDVFGKDFLTPLGEADIKYKLNTHEDLDLSVYKELSLGILNLEAHDLVNRIETPPSEIHVKAPCLSVSAFNPRSAPATMPRLPGLVHTATIIHDRSSHNPLNLDSNEKSFLELLEKNAKISK